MTRSQTGMRTAILTALSTAVLVGNVVAEGPLKQNATEALSKERRRDLIKEESANRAARATATKHYEPTWESLSQHGAAPQWYRDAVFGIYFHWGVYSVPAYGARSTRGICTK